jgi:hypothetical protein
VDGELFQAAQTSARTQSRSAAQQIDHWARIGRELEASPRVTQQAVRLVLSGQGSYDALSEESQAIVRANWEERIRANLAGLDLAEELRAAGAPWTEAAPDGTAVVCDPRAAG